MRASEYAMIGLPRMISSAEFCGIGGFSARTLSEFRAEILIDEHTCTCFN